MKKYRKIIFIVSIIIILCSLPFYRTSYAENSKRIMHQETYNFLRLGPGSTDSMPLSVIDQVLAWNTFLGSADEDVGCSIAVDGDGNIYVAGYCDASWGTPVNAFAGSYDAFVTKLNSSGVLLWNTFMGSSEWDEARGITVDGEGNVYVAGYSLASWGTPINPYVGSYDAFVTKLNTDGIIQWSTFMGSGSSDMLRGIAMDSVGNLYVVGHSSSAWGTPVNAYVGNSDVFVAKFNNGGELQWNTFMGSIDDDFAGGITVDNSSGNVYVMGRCWLTWGTPINEFSGYRDVFAAKLDNTGAFQWNTFMGSTGDDLDSGIAVDESEYIYVAGRSTLSWGIPINPHIGSFDAFVVKLDSSGVLQWNTFMGSSFNDEAYSVASDGNSNVFLTGVSSVTWGTPVIPHSGYVDAFVVKLNNSGILLWNAFMGSTDHDYGWGIAVDSNKNIYTTGYCKTSWGVPVNPFMGGWSDAFIAKIHEEPEINVRMGGVNFADGSTRNLGTRPSSLIMGRDFTFRVENLGSVSLNLIGMPEVTLSGSHGAHFQVTQQPTTPVPPYGSSTFKIRTVRDSLPGFLPLGWEYSVSFTVNIPNDDADENPYDFTINFTLKKD